MSCKPSRLSAQALLRLKAASRRLVEAVGGGKEAAAILGVSEPHVSTATAATYPDKWLSLRHVAELEDAAGVSLVAAALGELSEGRGDVVPIAAAELPDAVLRLTRELGDVAAVASVAVEDGRISAAERTRLLRELDDLTERAAALKDGLSAGRAGDLRAVAGQ
jgi:hypothetical protein